jgi:hypothetical protein
VETISSGDCQQILEAIEGWTGELARTAGPIESMSGVAAIEAIARRTWELASMASPIESMSGEAAIAMG